MTISKNFIKNFKDVIELYNLSISKYSINEIITLANAGLPKSEKFSVKRWEHLEQKSQNDDEMTNEEQKLVDIYKMRFLEQKGEIFDDLVASESDFELRKQKMLLERIEGEHVKPVEIIEKKQIEDKTKADGLDLLTKILGNIASALPKRLEREEIDADFEVQNE